MRSRLTLMILALLAFAVFLPSCRSGNNNSRRLLVYTPHGQDLLKDFIGRYKQQYPDADVQFLDMGSREVSSAFVLNETGRRLTFGGARRTRHFKSLLRRICSLSFGPKLGR